MGISYHHQRKLRRDSSKLYQSTGYDSRRFIYGLPPTYLSVDAFRSDIAVGRLIRGSVCQSISKLDDTPPGNSWHISLVNFPNTKRTSLKGIIIENKGIICKMKNHRKILPLCIKIFMSLFLLKVK